MGPVKTGGVQGAMSTAEMNLQATGKTLGARQIGSLKINYGDAAKAERLSMALNKIKNLQEQVQAHIAGIKARIES